MAEQGWTLDTVREHLGSRIDAADKLSAEREAWTKERFVAARDSVTSAMASADKALSKAEAANERRFDGVNEFRAALSDQTQTYMSRAEYAAQHNAISEKVDVNQDRIGKMEASLKGRSDGMGVAGSIALGSVAVISAALSAATLIFNLFLRH